MSDKEVKTTTLGSIGTSILVLVMLVIVVVVIIYVIQSAVVPSYPISPFNYEDTVTIRPAILTANPNITPDQYLTVSQTYTNPFGCTIPYDYGSASGVQLGYALTLNGKESDQRSQWVLKQFSSPGKFDSNQSLVYSLGNRFYLHNKANPDPEDPKSRARFQRLNEDKTKGLGQGFCYNTTPIVMGADGGQQSCNWFETEWLVYFLPTNYPDLYYILFPSCASDALEFLPTDLTRQPNNAIASVRPWAPNNTPSNVKIKLGCQQCDDMNEVFFNPFVNGDPAPFQFNQNALIANILPDNNLLPPYLNANVLLFEVKKLN